MANVITIDGPAGSGKTTIGRMLSKKINYNFLDSGILYRAVAYIAVKNNYSSSNPEDIKKLVQDIESGVVKLVEIENECQIEIGGKILTTELKTELVSKGAAEFSPFPEIRETVRKIQRRESETKNIIVAGRDIGTKVFPDSNVKFFINLSVEERAKRRVAQQAKMGEVVDYEKVLAGLKVRDDMDINREHGRMHTTDESIIIQNDKPLEEVLDTCEKYVRQRITFP
ncbi:MAG: (d)CMP kinase [bacterium]